MKRNLKLLKICYSLITRGCAGLILLSISSRMCSLMAMKKILNVHPPVAEEPEAEVAPPVAPLVVENLPPKQVKQQLQAEVVAPRKQQTLSWKKILMSVNCRRSPRPKLMRRSVKSHLLRFNRKVTIREERRMKNQIQKLSLSMMMKVKKRKRLQKDQYHVEQQQRNKQHHRKNQHHKKLAHHKAKDLLRRGRKSKKKMMKWMT